MGEKKRKLEALKRLSPTAKFIFEFTDRHNDIDMAPNPCLGCGVPLTCTTALEKGKRPRSGCFSICQLCGHIQAFGDDLKFRPLTDEEVVEIAGQESLVVANTIRGPLRDFWARKDNRGAFTYIRDRICKDVRNARR